MTGGAGGNVQPKSFAIRGNTFTVNSPFDFNGLSRVERAGFADLDNRAKILIEKLSKDGGFCK